MHTYTHTYTYIHTQTPTQCGAPRRRGGVATRRAVFGHNCHRMHPRSACVESGMDKVSLSLTNEA